MRSLIPWAKHKIRHVRLSPRVTTLFSRNIFKHGKNSGPPQTSKCLAMKKYNFQSDPLYSTCGVMSAAATNNPELEIHPLRQLDLPAIRTQARYAAN